MHSLFTQNPQDINRLLTDDPTLALLKSWHKHGSQKDAAHLGRASRHKNVPGLTPLGTLCLEAAWQRKDGWSFDDFIASAKKRVSGPHETKKNAS